MDFFIIPSCRIICYIFIIGDFGEVSHLFIDLLWILGNFINQLLLKYSKITTKSKQKIFKLGDKQISSKISIPNINFRDGDLINNDAVFFAELLVSTVYIK